MENFVFHLSKLPCWLYLNEKEKKLIESNAKVISYTKGTQNINSVDMSIGIMYVVKGRLRVYIASEEGREITLFNLTPGDVCVLSAAVFFSDLAFEFQTIAETDCEIIVIPLDVSSQISEENVYFECCVGKLLIKQLSRIIVVLQNVIFLTFEKRLAKFLLEEFEKTENLEIDLSHEEIARRIGSAREVVTRNLHNFSLREIVSIERRKTVIKDIEKLKTIVK